MNGNSTAAVDPNQLARRVIWSALTLVTSALAAVLARRLSEALWQRVFNEDPPE